MAAKYKHPANTKAGRHERVEAANKRRRAQAYKPYKPRSSSSSRSRSKSKSGCYVASCIYGSYDCPQVWTLRRYRDQKLSRTVLGRAFIRCYYAVSPTIVRMFGTTKLFHRFWKTRLDKMVQRLIAQGYSSDQYQD